jgi:tetratricopeptide (TPR) repeat protein
MLCVLFLGCWHAMASACFYGQHFFDPKKTEQTTVYALINERYSEEQSRKYEYFKGELKRVEQELPQRANDADFLDDYGVLLYKSGREADAFRVWGELLNKEPNRFSTLCNMATVYHNTSRFDSATTCLQAAVKGKPGFRNNAEQYHLQMVEYLQMQRKAPTSAAKRLFLDELTPAWTARRSAPETLQGYMPFPKVEADGLAELLRQFPKFGDGWLALGVVLEQSGDHYMANRAYERAMKFGTAHREELKTYMRTYTPYASERDPGRAVGRRLKWTIIICVVGLTLFFGLMLARKIVLDITSAKKEAASSKKSPTKRA